MEGGAVGHNIEKGPPKDTWPYHHHFSSIVRPSTFHILIFSSETTVPIATKLWWNGISHLEWRAGL
jgi:hypothetical protein